MSYCGNIWLLVWKNFRQETRRWKGLCAEIVSPVILFVLLGLLRRVVNQTDQAVDYGLPAFSPVYHDSAFSYDTLGSFRVMGNVLCSSAFVFNGDARAQSAGYFAVSPRSSQNGDVKRLLDELRTDWNASRAKWLPVFMNLSAYQNVFDGQTFRDLQLAFVTYQRCDYFNLQWSDFVREFGSNDELNTYMGTSEYSTGSWSAKTNINSLPSNRPVGFGVIFDSININTGTLEYTLRGNVSTYPTTDPQQAAVDRFTRSWQQNYASGFEPYQKRGFSYIQLFIDQAFTKLTAGSTTVTPYAFGSFAFAARAYKTDQFFAIAGGLMPLFWVLIFLYPYFVIVGNLVSEKASRNKEGLKMMGSSLTQFWISTYLYYFIKFAIIALVSMLTAQAFQVFRYSNPFIIFLWFFLYMLSLVSSGVLLSTVFDNPRTASMISVMILMVLFFLNLLTPLLNNETQYNLLCLSAPACFAISSGTWGTYESGLIGLQFDNINQEVQFFRFQTALIMMFVDTLVYTILALYLEKVVPSAFGQNYPPYFIFDPNFWCPERVKEYRLNRDGVPGVALETQDEKNYQKVEGAGAPIIQIKNLVKEFPMGFGKDPFRAVRGLNLELYQDQIFCLLGHNGAGKTTTINMLVGMLNISSGSATIDGKDVETEMDAIRSSLGVCPQHDVLWDTLTVREHLEFFAGLKGVPRGEVRAQAQQTADEVGLGEKVNKFPTELSGGQKRKLSLGIALIGGSKVVFLDEPTSGMDPASRRDAWQLIKNARKGRCIILTTHFMDEADLLGDRIAIMSHGQIQCVGSSLFLKKLYGVGYSFTISLNASVSAQEQQEPIMGVVKSHVSDASIVSSHGAELVVRLPFTQSKNFASLFRQVEASAMDLGVDSYGISVTTLEEVFIRVGEGEVASAEEAAKAKRAVGTDLLTVGDEEKDEGSTRKSVTIGEDGAPDPESEEVERRWSEMLVDIRERSQKTMWRKHMIAMLAKKFHYTKRDRRVLLCQVFCPLLFFLFAFAVVGTTRTALLPRVEFLPSQYGTPPVPYNNDGNTYNFVTNYNTLSGTFGSLEPIAVAPQSTSWTTAQAFNDKLLTFTSERYNGLLFRNQTVLPALNILTKLYKARNPNANITVLNSTQMVAAGVVPITPQNYMLIGANASARHGWPISVNMASNMLLRRYKSTGKIRTFTSPLPTTVAETQAQASFNGFTYSILIGMGLAFFPVGPMYNVVFERESLTKHQQLVSGLDFIVYWSASFVWDSITILPASIGGLCLAAAFTVDVFTKDGAAGVFFLVILLYGFAVVSFTYMFSWVFKNAQRAQYISLGVYIFAGWLLAFAGFIMDLITSTQEANKVLKHIYRIFPSYIVTNTLQHLALRRFGFSQANIPINASVWDWNVSGYNFMILAFQAVGYFIVTLIIEYLSTIPSVLALLGISPNAEPPKEQLDSDVALEQEKIRSMIKPDGTLSCQDPVVLGGLRKCYSSQRYIDMILGRPAQEGQLNIAVRDIYYTVPRGQVFGFLGVNGAGKTSTLSMLSGRYPPSNGNAWINQIPITDQIACRRMIGYCPQFDALFDLLTGREHLYVYGQLKGLEWEEIEKQSEELITKLTLGKYADRPAGTYSGGNKRKLSVAVAMIGNPPIVFLDEPSTGMDPVSRRHMWDYISSTMHGRSVVLTTHSMEECEALCHRIGIMVRGQLRCLGTAQHLKSKFGEGYQLDLTISVDQQDAYHKALTDHFPQTKLLERHDMNIIYRIEGTQEFSLADMFEMLEGINDGFNLESYSLNQTSLEQIFIQMAALDPGENTGVVGQVVGMGGGHNDTRIQMEAVTTKDDAGAGAATVDSRDVTRVL